MELLTVQVKRSVVIVRDFPGLGKRIKNAREGDERSLVRICKDSGVSRTYWYQIENEATLSPITEDVVRRIEAALSIDLGVTFD